MDFKFTFEDGSEAIAHHGVKGMKWGVRNAETLAKYGLKNANPAGGGGGTVSEEYLEEKEYNSKKNQYASESDSEPESENIVDKIAKTVDTVKTSKKAGEEAVNRILGKGAVSSASKKISVAASGAKKQKAVKENKKYWENSAKKRVTNTVEKAISNR